VRCLALDIGDRRIGVASGEWLASPVMTLVRGSLSEDLDAVARLVREHQVRCLVVGLPLNMDGSVGFQAQRVTRYAERLRAALVAMGIDIDLVFWDERLTTSEAEQVMARAGRRRDGGRAQVDAVAAAVILQSYLDAQSREHASGSVGIGK
jgi:putative pre-16S rRNA nuclease